MGLFEQLVLNALCNAASAITFALGSLHSRILHQNLLSSMCLDVKLGSAFLRSILSASVSNVFTMVFRHARNDLKL